MPQFNQTISQPAFSAFLERLAQNGFTIGVTHHLRLRRLFANLEGYWEPQQLRTLLCPLFATSLEEQQLFYELFDGYFAELLASAPVPPDFDSRQTARLKLPGPGKEEFKPPRVLAWTILVLTLLGLLVVLSRFTPKQITPPPPAPESPTPVVTVTQVPGPSVTVTVTPTPPPATPSATVAPTSAQPINLWLAARRRWIQALACALLLLGYASYEWWRWRQRQAQLERARGQKPPFTWPIQLRGVTLAEHRTDTFYRAARSLRRRQIAEFQRLDLPATIQATIHAAGTPSFRYRPDSRVPEYLALIERRSWRDHQAQLFEAHVEALKNEGVFITRYYYDRDPRICWEAAAARNVRLAELQKRFSAHRLLLFGDGEHLLDPLDGRPASWLALLHEWPERALLTPISRTAWTQRERTLAEHFVLLPATLPGLDALTDRLEMPELRIAPFSDEAASNRRTPTEQATVEELRDYLGRQLFQWLCTCAIYPELHWDLTLRLGALPCWGQNLATEQNLLRLSRLPWFRTGALPDALRWSLLEELSQLNPAAEAEARRAVLAALEENPPPTGSTAAQRQTLEILAQQFQLARDKSAARRTATPQLAQFPRHEILREYALARLLETAPNRLALRLPDWWRRALYESGIPAFGWKRGARAGATALLALGLWLGLGVWLPQSPAMKLFPRKINYQEIAKWSGDDVGINAVAFSLDGSLIASEGENSLRLWGTQTQIPRFLEHKESLGERITAFAFSPEGQVQVLGDKSGYIQFSDGYTNTVSPAHSARVNQIVFSPNGRTFASASDDGTVKLWERDGLQLKQTLSGHTRAVNALAFSPDGQTLVSGGSDSTLCWWNVAEGRRLRSLPQRGLIHAISFSPDGKLIASASLEAENSIWLWDAVNGRLVATLNSSFVTSLAFTPDSQMLVAGTSGKQIQLWDVAARAVSATIPAPEAVNAVALSPDGRLLVAGGVGGWLRLWGLANPGEPLPSLTPSGSFTSSPTTTGAYTPTTTQPSPIVTVTARPRLTSTVVPVTPTRTPEPPLAVQLSGRLDGAPAFTPITAIPTRTQQTWQTMSDEDGNFTFASLPPDVYRISVTRKWETQATTFNYDLSKGSVSDAVLSLPTLISGFRVALLHDAAHATQARQLLTQLRNAGFQAELFEAYQLERPQGGISFRPPATSTKALGLVYFNQQDEGRAYDVLKLVSGEVKLGGAELWQEQDNKQAPTQAEQYFKTWVRINQVKVQISLLSEDAWRGLPGGQRRN